MLKSQQQGKKQNGLKLAGPLVHRGMDLRRLLTLGQRAGGEAERLGLEQKLGLDAVQQKRPKAKRPRVRDDGSTGTVGSSRTKCSFFLHERKQAAVELEGAPGDGDDGWRRMQIRGPDVPTEQQRRRSTS